MNASTTLPREGWRDMDARDALADRLHQRASEPPDENTPSKPNVPRMPPVPAPLYGMPPPRPREPVNPPQTPRPSPPPAPPKPRS